MESYVICTGGTWGWVIEEIIIKSNDWLSGYSGVEKVRENRTGALTDQLTGQQTDGVAKFEC